MRNKIYSKWLELKAFCNPSNKKYKGFTICEDWLVFNNFKNWWDKNFEEGLVFHYDEEFLCPKNCRFLEKKLSNKIKIKKSNLKKYGVEHTSQLENFKEKVSQPQSKENIEKRSKAIKEVYKNKKQEIKSKKIKNSIEKYGVEHPSKLNSVKDKFKQTCLKKYGCEHHSQNETVKNKTKKSHLTKYNGYFIASSQGIKKKQETCLRKYGKIHYNKTEEGKLKLRKSSIKNGRAIVVGGKTLTEIAKEKRCSPSTIHQNYKIIGKDIVIFNKRHSLIESRIKKYLQSINIDFLHNKKFGEYFPDFRLKNIIIECDGLYWHSDQFLENNYHKEKREYYISQGYKPLFFREDEILNNFDIVKSIINNSLGLNNKIFARNTRFTKVDYKEAKNFLNQNHLMGSITSRCYGLYTDKLVAIMSVKKINSGLDISRFCCLNNLTIVGGFTKLIKNIQKDLSPDFIQTFIDLRYGSGKYLSNLGFKKESENLSFKWFKNSKTFHRMSFPGNKGYEKGFYKIWDCGQAKWKINFV